MGLAAYAAQPLLINTLWIDAHLIRCEDESGRKIVGASPESWCGSREQFSASHEKWLHLLFLEFLEVKEARGAISSAAPKGRREAPLPKTVKRWRESHALSPSTLEGSRDGSAALTTALPRRFAALTRVYIK